MPSNDRLLGLDIGHVRIGVATAIPSVGLASPLITLANDDSFNDRLLQLVIDQQPDGLIVGLPRNLSGDDTPQTAYVRSIVESLQSRLDCPVVYQDEALTSKKAEAELVRRGKPYQKGDIDALAAVYILEDYMEQHRVTQ